MLDDGKGGLNANAIVAKMYCTIKNKTSINTKKINENG